MKLGGVCYLLCSWSALDLCLSQRKFKLDLKTRVGIGRGIWTFGLEAIHGCFNFANEWKRDFKL